MGSTPNRSRAIRSPPKADNAGTGQYRSAARLQQPTTCSVSIGGSWSAAVSRIRRMASHHKLRTDQAIVKEQPGPPRRSCSRMRKFTGLTLGQQRAVQIAPNLSTSQPAPEPQSPPPHCGTSHLETGSPTPAAPQPAGAPTMDGTSPAPWHQTLKQNPAAVWPLYDLARRMTAKALQRHLQDILCSSDDVAFRVET